MMRLYNTTKVIVTIRDKNIHVQPVAASVGFHNPGLVSESLPSRRSRKVRPLEQSTVQAFESSKVARFESAFSSARRQLDVIIPQRKVRETSDYFTGKSMGVLSAFKRLLSKPVAPEPPAAQQAPTEAEARQKEARASTGTPTGKRIKLPSKIDDLLEMGLTVHSPNRKWTVGYADPGPTLSRESIVRLRNNETREICATVRSLVRPFAVDVSDVGVWVVDDAGPASELSSKVVAFDSAGEELYRRAYRANLLHMNISPCGRYIASVTANSSNEDSYILEVHDVQERRVVFSRTPATTTHSTYVFETEENQLVKVFAKLPKLGRFGYAASGEFLDKKKYLTARLTKGSYGERIPAVQELIAKDSSEKALRQALASVEVAIAESGESRSWQVTGWLLKAKILESLGQPGEAVKAYEAARHLNPRAITKKEIDALANMLPSDASAAAIQKTHPQE
ncbi:hypothetical protein LMG23994_01728 [Cupriavidus pinatubonensis]|uniref:Tetratricopeptide repeat protein n=2 Tax=Cupriavidus pinatubonensis TaxID=248026 RepID=A0ABN7YDH2_9BURK|nr:hypothetical protein LMG23994_01728 [Cupriavidus pinatubonensis]